MTIYLLITAFISVSLGFAILLHSMAHAPAGFEDEAGFHCDAMPAMARATHAYRGEERRQAARASEGAPRFGERHYYGALRRASDFKSSGGGLPGFA